MLENYLQGGKNEKQKKINQNAFSIVQYFEEKMKEIITTVPINLK